MKTADFVLVSAHGDGHGDMLAERAAARAMTVWRTSVAELDRQPLIWAPGGLHLAVGEFAIAPRTPGFFRRPGLPEPRVTDSDEAFAVAEELAACFEGILDHLDLQWLDSPDAIRRTENKIYQYGQLRTGGIPVPPSIVTSSREAAREFAGSRRVVVKALGGGTIESPRDTRVLFTTEFDATDPDLLAAVAVSPVLLQERVEVQADYRAVTVGPRAFVFERPRRPREPIDWRETDPAGTGFRPSSDSEVAAWASKASGVLGLSFSSQDWVRAVDGTLWMLDANPAGQWLFLPDPEPITEALLDLVSDGR